MPDDLIQSISAITLATHDMKRAVDFYESVGFRLHYGGRDAAFTSFGLGSTYLNLILQPRDRAWSWWGRAIFLVTDVDALYQRLLSRGLTPLAAPRDAEWGERYFAVIDPDGHELSFVRPLAPRGG
jgi:catechol 2,3-dioxygenase-like lactoylglutathione lyase family enzyme